MRTAGLILSSCLYMGACSGSTPEVEVAVPLATSLGDPSSCTHRESEDTSIESYQSRLAVCAQELAVVDQAVAVARDVTGKLPADFLYVRAVVSAEIVGLQRTIEAKRSRQANGDEHGEAELESPDPASLGLGEPSRYETIAEVEAALHWVRSSISGRETTLRNSRPRADPVRYWRRSQALHVLRVHEARLTHRRSQLVRHEDQARS